MLLCLPILLFWQISRCFFVYMPFLHPCLFVDYGEAETKDTIYPFRSTIWGIERSGFFNDRENGWKALITKDGLGMVGENRLNISKRFFPLHGLTSALRLMGFSADLRGLLYIGLADGAKTSWKGFDFRLCVLFYGWVDGFCYMMMWTAVWPFFCAYFKI